MFKISKTQQVALCLALTLQLCFIWVCLPVHPLCLCVCLAFGRIIYALSGLPFRIILRSLAQSSGLQSVFPGSALICFTAFLVTLTLVSVLPSYFRRCFEFWLFHFILWVGQKCEGHNNLDLSHLSASLCWIPKYLPAHSSCFELQDTIRTWTFKPNRWLKKALDAP